MKRTPGDVRRLVRVGRPEAMLRLSGRGLRRPAVRQPEPRLAARAGRMAGRAERRFAATGLRARGTGKRGPTAASHPEAMQIDEPPTRTGFITALDDAYLMPREEATPSSGGRRAATCARSGPTSPSARCAARARSSGWAPGRARCADATTTGRCGGRAGCPGPRPATWPAASDVLPLIDALAGGARARAGSRAALGAAAPGRRAARWSPAPRPRRPARPRLLGGLRALFRAH